MPSSRFTFVETEKARARGICATREDYINTDYSAGSPLALSAGVWSSVALDYNTLSNESLPFFIEEIWNSAAQRIYLDDEPDEPDYVASLKFNAVPSVSSVESLQMRLIIDEAGGYGGPYYSYSAPASLKGSGEVAPLLTFYIGDAIKSGGARLQLMCSVDCDVHSVESKFYKT